MISIAAVAIAANLSIDLGASLLGMFIFLKEHDARAFGDDKATAVLVERQGGSQRILGLGQSLAIGETADGNRVNTCLTTTCDDGIGITVLDGTVGLTDRVSACGTGRYNRDAIPLSRPTSTVT